MLGTSKRQVVRSSHAKEGRPHRESRRHYEDSGKGLPLAEKETEGILVKPENLQATFENLVSVISSSEELSFSRVTVQKMVESIYVWMVFDDNNQIFLPSSLEADMTRKMWPHGSKVDTRKKKDSSDAKPSPRRLREVDEDHAQTVASSVVSSALDEDCLRARKGSVTYIDQLRPEPLAYYAHPQQEQAYVPLFHQGSGHPQAAAYRAPQATPQAVPLTSQEDPRRNARSERVVPRYSIIGGAVNPPERVTETPQQHHVEVVPRRTVKKTRVGASARPVNSAEEGTPVVWGD
jgi:hypothetical protein